MVSHDGGFVFRDVAPGTYTIDVLAPDHVFPQYRVDVLPPGESVIPWEIHEIATISPAPTPSSSPSPPDINVYPIPPGTPHLHNPRLPLLSYPIKFQAAHRRSYEIPKQSFDIIGMFSNPMMLMMLFTGIMMFAMPKLMENMDPELVKEVKEKQDRMFSAQSRLTEGGAGGLSSLLAEATSKPPGGQSGGSKKAGGKKRK